jgi:hypothetical protein
VSTLESRWPRASRLMPASPLRAVFAGAAMLTAAFGSVVAAPAAAAEDVSYPLSDVQMHGEIWLDGIVRDPFFGVTGSTPGLAQPKIGQTGSTLDQWDAFGNVGARVDLSIEIPPKVRGVVTFASDPYKQQYIGAGGRFAEIKQAYVSGDELGWEQLSFKVGAFNVARDWLDRPEIARSRFMTQGLWKRGNRLLLDVQHAINPYRTTLADATTPITTLDSGGVEFKWADDKAGYRGSFTYAVALEQNLASQDQTIALLDHTLYGGNSAITFLVASFGEDISRSITTLGMAWDVYQPMDAININVYGEIYAQTGRTRTWMLTGSEVDHEAYAGAIHIRFFGDSRGDKDAWTDSYFDFAYWAFSGDRQQAGTTSRDFVSYRNVENASLIVEDTRYGLGRITNYRAFKLRAGFRPAKFMKLDFLLTQFEQDSRTTDPTESDQLGSEIDVRFTWEYASMPSTGIAQSSLDFEFAIGYLFNSTYYNAFTTANHPTNLDSGKDALMAKFAVRFKF